MGTFKITFPLRSRTLAELPSLAGASSIMFEPFHTTVERLSDICPQTRPGKKQPTSRRLRIRDSALSGAGVESFYASIVGSAATDPSCALPRDISFTNLAGSAINHGFHCEQRDTAEGAGQQSKYPEEVSDIPHRFLLVVKNSEVTPPLGVSSSRWITRAFPGISHGVMKLGGRR